MSAARCAAVGRCVSIHAPVRGATIQPLKQFTEDKFQSTRPYGARRVSSYADCLALRFQSTRPYGARPSCGTSAIFGTVFQSTRPYGARPKVHWRYEMQDSVSIHAPVRGATSRFGTNDIGGSRFNPRARTGRDQKSIGDMKCKTAFQSTRPYGARRHASARTTLAAHVSIHAPVRGATSVRR